MSPCPHHLASDMCRYRVVGQEHRTPGPRGGRESPSRAVHVPPTRPWGQFRRVGTGVFARMPNGDLARVAIPFWAMAIDPDSLLRDALTLPADRRAEFAADLLASLDRDEHDDPDAVRAAWAAELERRARRALSGEDPGRPWPEVRERIRSKLAR
jgi:putative addiction module component (TIGR02574 family)